MTISKAAQDFLMHCQFEKTLSTKTLKAYGIDLVQARTALELMGCVKISDVDKSHIRRYLSSLFSRKPKTIKRKMASLKAFFNYLEFEDIILVNPFRKMRLQIREPKVLPSVLELPEIIRLFRKAHERWSKTAPGSSRYSEALRNIVVLELLFCTGARVSEIAGLKRTSIQVMQQGSITIRGKGNKERLIQLCNPDTISLLRKYVDVNGEAIRACGGWLLTNRLNRRLSDQSIRLMLRSLATEAGIKRRITPHVFRHSFATLLLERDVDIKYIQVLLGHSSIVTTQIYTHVTKRRQKEILRAKHPRRSLPSFELSE